MSSTSEIVTVGAVVFTLTIMLVFDEQPLFEVTVTPYSAPSATALVTEMVDAVELSDHLYVTVLSEVTVKTIAVVLQFNTSLPWMPTDGKSESVSTSTVETAVQPLVKSVTVTL